MQIIKTDTALTLVTLLAACLSQTQITATASEPEKIFETNITRDLAISSGEPQIAVDPTNPHNLAIIEFGLGSSKVPAYTINPVLDAKPGTQWKDANVNLGRLMLSHDGGNTWSPSPAPAFDPDTHVGGGDPMIAYGPDGSIYAADGTGKPPQSNSTGLVLEGATLRDTNIYLPASMDGGKIFGPPQLLIIA
jgi:hypothetical protein